MGINFCKPKQDIEVRFRKGDDVNKVVEGTKKLIIDSSFKKVPDGDPNEWICPFPGYETIEEIVFEDDEGDDKGDEGGVTVIGISSFAQCKKLKKVSFPSSLKEIHEGAFTDCFCLDEIDLSHTNVTHIHKWAFNECYNLQKVSFPKSLEVIGPKAFYKCDSIIDNDDIRSKINNQFYSTVTFGEGDDIDRKVIEGTKKLIIDSSIKTIPKGTYDDNSPFPGYEAIEELIIEEGVEIIQYASFSACANLKKVTFPSTIKEIGALAFWGCENLVKIDISHCTNITEIGEAAFQNCKQLETVCFPPTKSLLRKITYNAFDRCDNLSKETRFEFESDRYFPPVTFRDGDEINKVVEGTKKLTIDGSVKEVPEGSYEQSPYSGYNTIEELILEEGVEVIGKYTFYGYYKLKKVVFPSTLKTIGEGAFGYCDNLTEIDLSNTSNITKIGSEVFRGCTQLNKLSFPSSLEEIEERAFYYCQNLTNLELSYTKIKSIGKQAFAGCERIEDVRFPPSSSLNKLATDAFDGCVNISDKMKEIKVVK